MTCNVRGGVAGLDRAKDVPCGQVGGFRQEAEWYCCQNDCAGQASKKEGGMKE